VRDHASLGPAEILLIPVVDFRCDQLTALIRAPRRLLMYALAAESSIRSTVAPVNVDGMDALNSIAEEAARLWHRGFFPIAEA
jgi:hypothetical protein